MKKLFLILGSILIVSSFLLAACSSPPPATPAPTTAAPVATTAAPTTPATTAPASTTPAAPSSPPVELKLWSGWASDKWTTKPYMHWFLETYKDRFAEANITFKYIGGPEVFPNT